MPRKKLLMYYTPEQENSFLDVIDNEKHRDLFKIFFGTGGRACEIVGETQVRCITCTHLMRKQLDKSSKKTTPFCQLTGKPLPETPKFWKCDQHEMLHPKLRVEQINLEEATVKIFGKGSKEREVMITPRALEAFKRVVGNRKTGEIDFGIGIRRVEQLAAIYAKKAKLPELGQKGRWSPHKMRHTHLTEIVNKARDMGQTEAVLLAKEQAGHERIETTLQYLHVSNEARKKVVNKLDI